MRRITDHYLFWMYLGGVVGIALAVAVGLPLGAEGVLASLLGGVGSLGGMWVGGNYGIKRRRY